MNSGAKRFSRSWLGVGVLIAAGSLVLAVGCSDRGPTNLYSETFFGQNQAGAQMQIWRVEEGEVTPETTTAGMTSGTDGYVIWLKDTGQGGTVGPILATFTSATPANPCATPVTFGASVLATAVFGYQGEVINPGDTVMGEISDSHGNVQNSWISLESSFTSCSPSTNVTFNMTATDPHNSSWTGSFSGITE